LEESEAFVATSRVVKYHEVCSFLYSMSVCYVHSITYSSAESSEFTHSTPCIEVKACRLTGHLCCEELIMLGFDGVMR